MYSDATLNAVCGAVKSNNPIRGKAINNTSLAGNAAGSCPGAKWLTSGKMISPAPGLLAARLIGVLRANEFVMDGIGDPDLGLLMPTACRLPGPVRVLSD
jgi:hypothetical protein